MIIQDEVPQIYLYNQPWYFAMSARLSGFQLHPDGMIRLGGSSGSEGRIRRWQERRKRSEC